MGQFEYLLKLEYPEHEHVRLVRAMLDSRWGIEEGGRMTQVEKTDSFDVLRIAKIISSLDTVWGFLHGNREGIFIKFTDDGQEARIEGGYPSQWKLCSIS